MALLFRSKRSTFSASRFYPKNRFQWFCLAASLLLIVYIYTAIVYKHGTLFPGAVMYFTAPMQGRTTDDNPPPNWRPDFRVVFTLTTTPGRIQELAETLQTLEKQTLPPDVIYVNIPQGAMKRKPDQVYPVVDQEQLQKELGSIVSVSIVEDLGPLTKLIRAVEAEQALGNGDTLVVTVDDDKLYPPTLMANLAWDHLLNPNTALGVCGWGMIPTFRPKGVVSAYVPYFMRPTGRYVDVLQAVCGSAFRADFFPHLDELKDVPEACITVDDVWIAGFLQVREKHPRAIISKRLDPTNRRFEADQTSLSLINRVEPTHIRCTDAIEARYGPWKRVYQYSQNDYHPNEELYETKPLS